MEKKIVRNQLDLISKDLNVLLGIRGTSLARAILSLDSAHSDEMHKLKELRKAPQTPEVIECQKALEALYKEHLHKDADGNLLRDQFGNYRIKDQSVFDVASSNLVATYPEAKRIFDEVESKYEAYINEEIVLTYDDISISDLPDNLNSRELELVYAYFEDCLLKTELKQ